MTSNLISEKIPACLSWMVRDFADVSVEEDEENSDGYLEAHAEANRLAVEAKGEDGPMTVSLSVDGWTMLMDELEMLAGRDLFPESEAQARKIKSTLATERRELNKLWRKLEPLGVERL